MNAVEDAIDISGGTSIDANGNTVPDECDLRGDFDGNGIVDPFDYTGFNGCLTAPCEACVTPLYTDPVCALADFDEDGDVDLADYGSSQLALEAWAVDCNSNLVPDGADMASGTSTDLNSDNVPDECETVRYVDAGATGMNNGTSWSNAYPNLQDALADAMGDDSVTQIWVAAGTYTPDQGGGQVSGDRTVTFQLQDELAIFGGFFGTETSLSQRDPQGNVTVLSGDLMGNDNIFTNNGENSLHVVTGSGTGATAMLDGFTIRGGNSDGTSPDDHGAGMFNDSGSPTVRNCVWTENDGTALYNLYSSPMVTSCGFVDNIAGMHNEMSNPSVIGCTFVDTGGMFNSESSPIVTSCTFMNNLVGMENQSSHPTVLNCDFVNNTMACSAFCTVGGGMRNVDSNPIVTGCQFDGNSSQTGGGMSNADSSPTVTYCTFSENSATYGGGISNSGGSPTISHCTFIENSASHGGGLSNYTAGIPTVTQCTFIKNSASDGGGIYNYSSDPILANCRLLGNSAMTGGGIYNVNCNPPVVNVVFSGNHASDEGGGMHTEGGVQPLTNCTFSRNTSNEAFDYGAAMSGGSYTVTNCIIWENRAQGIFSTFENSILQGGGEPGTIDADPLFVDADGFDDIAGTEDDDLRISPGSSAIDAGDNSAVPAEITLDVNGTPRFTDDPNTLDTGVGSAPIVDIGAHEFRVGSLLFVDANVGGGANNGSGWPDAYVDLQDALMDASTNAIVEQIWVAAGTHTPDRGGGNTPGDRTATFQLRDGLGLYGGFAATESSRDERDPATNITILSGDLWGDDVPNFGNYGDNSFHVVTGSATNHTALLDGFTIMAGFANQPAPNDRGAGMRNEAGSPTVTHCVFAGNLADFGAGMLNASSSNPVITACDFTANVANVGGGGGMYNDASSPTMTGCSFTHNNGLDGAGILNVSSHPEVMDCTFSENAALAGGGGILNRGSSPNVTLCVFNDNSGDSGGGIANEAGSLPIIRDCTFLDNSAAWGGGMTNVLSDATVSRCAFTSNGASVGGGGIFNDGVGNPQIDNCKFSGNTAPDGAGLFNQSDNTAAVTNCIFNGNIASNHGGGIFNQLNSSPMVTNCTLAGNSAAAGGAMYSDSGSPVVTNCIAWENSPDGIVSTGGASQVNHSIVQGDWGGAGGNGVLDADPLLVDFDGPDDIAGTTDDDLHLSAGSPAIDAGDGDAVPAGIATDLDGHRRILNDPNTADTGPTTPLFVDMGAYEFGGSAILFVNANATGGLNNGSSWNDAYVFLQDAFLEASVLEKPVEIWVAAGSYTPDRGVGKTLGDRNQTFRMQNNVSLFGGFIGTETSRDQRDFENNVTVLTGDLLGNDSGFFGGIGENSYHVVVGTYQNASALLDGFTIAKGHANGYSNSTKSGGGMFIGSGSPTVRNCVFRENSVTLNGAGICNINQSHPEITNCRFIENRVWNGSGNPGGAGIYNRDSSPVITNCAFIYNNGLRGGGVNNKDDSSPTIINCAFIRNIAVFAGGGIHNDEVDSSPTIINCTFAQNSAQAGSAIYSQEGSPTVSNSIFWENYGADIVVGSGVTTINHSIVQDGWTGAGGVGIIDADPLFVDADGVDDTIGTEDDDVRLSAQSPAINAGSNSEIPLGVTTDLDGNARFADDFTGIDCANGGTCAYSLVSDLGAYEFQGSPCELAFDCNSNGVEDECEIAGETAPDCNGNEIPDECEDLLAVRYVNSSVTGGANDGSSWSNAYANLQDALAEAADLNCMVNELWVATGTYRPDEGGGQMSGDRGAAFRLRDNLVIYGGFDGSESVVDQRNPDLHPTILSGDLLGDDLPDFVNYGDNSLHVVIGSGTNDSAILDGFTIVAGNADGAFPNNSGAGLFNDTGDPTITHCRFTKNAGTSSGGMANIGGSPTVTYCAFEGNAGSFGAGMLNVDGNPILTNCVFIGNVASDGGGMRNSNSNPTLVNCVFSGNFASNLGGAMYNVGFSEPVFTNCTFSENESNLGGAMYNVLSSPIVTNCVFWNNTPNQIATINATPVVEFSIVQGSWDGAGGAGVLDADPLFADYDGADDIVGTSDDDLRLTFCSPAIDAGDNGAVPLGTLTDLDARPRFVDNPNTLDTGVGTPPIVDMGAYEFFPDCNTNAIDDALDIASGTSLDCNTNGMPDECEFTGQCATPCDSVLLNEDFDVYGVGQDPADWFDTESDSSHVEDDSLFNVKQVDGELVLGTDSTLTNIHSHYVGPQGEDFSTITYTGRLRISSDGAGIGVTFLSGINDQPTSVYDYHRLRRANYTPSARTFHLAPPGANGLTGDLDSGVDPAIGVWYRFHIEVDATGPQVRIQANVWEDGLPEPSGYQIDATDTGGLNQPSGTIGIWSMGTGNKYWDDLQVDVTCPVFTCDQDNS
ncbi:MAG: right-handed parallel beta-helix repeat-containing protein [Phycisphaerales bacterium]|nr:right-handed parallel beta-helix repeat-containing protein [Phycisphaerales bacterium]